MGRPKKDVTHIFNTVMHSKSFGDFIPLYESQPLYDTNGSYLSRMITVKFVDTGTIDTFRLTNVLTGEIKDVYRPNICGVACIGHVQIPTDTKIYDLFYDMIGRCYNPKRIEYSYYGARGITVCQRWLCFENFLEDVKHLPNFDIWYSGADYQLDKDTLQQGVPDNQKVYSPTTCMFINRLDNLKEEYLSRVPKNNFRGAQISSRHNDGTIIYATQVNPTPNTKIYLGSFYSREAAARLANEWFLANGRPLNRTNMSMAEAELYRAYNKNDKDKAPIIVDECKVLLYKLIDK